VEQVYGGNVSRRNSVNGKLRTVDADNVSDLMGESCTELEILDDDKKVGVTWVIRSSSRQPLITLGDTTAATSGVLHSVEPPKTNQLSLYNAVATV